MYNYTTTVTFQPVVNANWDPFYDFIDTVPGAVLVENPNQPLIMCDVDGNNWNKAQMFILGLAELLGLGVVRIEQEECRKSEGSQTIPDSEIVDDWVARAPHRRPLCMN